MNPEQISNPSGETGSDFIVPNNVVFAQLAGSTDLHAYAATGGLDLKVRGIALAPFGSVNPQRNYGMSARNLVFSPDGNTAYIACGHDKGYTGTHDEGFLLVDLTQSPGSYPALDTPGTFASLDDWLPLAPGLLQGAGYDRLDKIVLGDGGTRLAAVLLTTTQVTLTQTRVCGSSPDDAGARVVFFDLQPGLLPATDSIDLLGDRIYRVTTHAEDGVKNRSYQTIDANAR